MDSTLQDAEEAVAMGPDAEEDQGVQSAQVVLLAPERTAACERMGRHLPVIRYHTNQPTLMGPSHNKKAKVDQSVKD
jgi:hypothetical protein